MKENIKEGKVVKNKRGILGWIYLKGGNFERYLYALHRITGFILVVYITFHIILMGSRSFSEDAWKKVLGFLGITIENGVYKTNPLVHFLEYLLILAILFHAFNGMRLIFTEIGFLIGKPSRPEYPYIPKSIVSSRPFMIFLMIIAFFFAIIGIYEFFLIH